MSSSLEAIFVYVRANGYSPGNVFLYYLLTCLSRVLSLLQGYFGKECFIKLAPFAVVIGVGLVTGN